MRGPLHRYRALVEAGALEADPAQEQAILRLQSLEDDLSRPPGLLALFAPHPAPKGVYLWGGVGRGKTLLMDIFFNNSAAALKRRVHFHEFMAETHERVAAFRALGEQARRRHAGSSRSAPDDPIPPVARDIAHDARLLCFDEFQVTDIADAMVLGRLFEALMSKGVAVVATSNRHPDALYKDGLNRQLFLPFIAMLKSRLDVVELAARRDYRLALFTAARVYHRPLGPAADAAMDASWERVICGGAERAEALEIKGRRLAVPRAARGAARFAFDDLCRAALGASDYIAVARRYGTVFIDRIPLLRRDERNEAARFVALIDALYDARTKLVCSADGEPDELYPAGDGAFEFARAASRLVEMRSAAYLGAERIGAMNDAGAAALGQQRPEEL